VTGHEGTDHVNDHVKKSDRDKPSTWGRQKQGVCTRRTQDTGLEGGSQQRLTKIFWPPKNVGVQGILDIFGQFWVTFTTGKRFWCLLSFILLCLVHFCDNSASHLIVLPYLECLHKISNKEIFFPDRYRMLFSSGDTAGRKVNSILGQKIMFAAQKWPFMDVREQPEGGGGLEVVIWIFRPCVGDFCPAYPLGRKWYMHQKEESRRHQKWYCCLRKIWLESIITADQWRPSLRIDLSAVDRIVNHYWCGPVSVNMTKTSMSSSCSSLWFSTRESLRSAELHLLCGWTLNLACWSSLS